MPEGEHKGGNECKWRFIWLPSEFVEWWKFLYYYFLLFFLSFISPLLPPSVPSNSRRWPFQTFCRHSIHVCTCGEAWVIESSGYVTTIVLRARILLNHSCISYFTVYKSVCMHVVRMGCGKWSKARKLIKYWFINFPANLSCFTDLLHYCSVVCVAWFCWNLREKNFS